MAGPDFDFAAGRFAAAGFAAAGFAAAGFAAAGFAAGASGAAGLPCAAAFVAPLGEPSGPFAAAAATGFPEGLAGVAGLTAAGAFGFAGFVATAFVGLAVFGAGLTGAAAFLGSGFREPTTGLRTSGFALDPGELLAVGRRDGLIGATFAGAFFGLLALVEGAGRFGAFC